MAARNYKQSVKAVMKALLGRKLGMTEVIAEDGVATPVTLVQAGPCKVVGVKTHDTDGYDAVLLGYEVARKPAKAQTKQYENAGSMPRYVREIRGNFDVSVGDVIDVSGFEQGDAVTVTGTAKGKGFSGTIKRHNFSRGPVSHGSRNVRRPGSIGGMYPQKVYKGRKMPGRHGGKQTTVKGLQVKVVDHDKNLVAVTGALPGANKGLLTIRGHE